MKHTVKNGLRMLCALALVGCAATFTGARDRDQARVISAKAGGVNHVAGDVSVRRAGATEWKGLTASDDLKSGDAVRTGADGRAEILLNPGSYLRLGRDTEFVFAETSLDRLRLKLSAGSAVVEATGYSDIDVLVTVETPEAQVSILRSGLYRFNAARPGATEVFVHDGRASVRGALVKGGQFVRVAGVAGAVPASKFDKKQHRDALDLWSRERAKELAQVNARLQRRNVNTLLAHSRLDDLLYGFGGYVGVWLWSPLSSCYTFLPFSYGGWPSPYGFSYSTGFSYYSAGLCSSCLHPRLRQRWDTPPNDPSWAGWNGGGVSAPGVPKSTTAADWKMPSSAAAPGGSRTTTERNVGGDAGSGKGDKP